MENGLTGGLFWKMYGFVLAPYDDGVVEFFGLPNLVGGAQAISFFNFGQKWNSLRCVFYIEEPVK
jgi:hypothetical protein